MMLAMPTMAVRCFGVPICLFGTFVLSYMSACFIAIIEQTAEGRDKIVEWPSGYWRDWFWSMPSTLGMLAPPLAAVGLLGGFTGFHPWWLYMLAVVLVYPVLMLSALDNGSAANPFSIRVLRSLKTVWWAWAMVYGASILMAVGWYAAVKPPFAYQPMATVLPAAPAAVALIFIYARLLGRLCWCFDHYEEKS
jgi:hypothetical protein